MSRTKGERASMIRRGLWGDALIVTVDAARTRQREMFARNRRGNAMLKIDPHHGTEKIQKLKADIYRRGFTDRPRLDLDLTYTGDTATWEDEGFELEAKLVLDEDYGVRLEDDESLGEFADHPDHDDAIKLDPDDEGRHADYHGLVRDRDSAYWSHHKTGTIAETRAHASHKGMSRAVAEEWARANQRMFLRRALDTLRGEIVGVGVVVTASRAGVTLAEQSLWGIESDAGDYFNEVAEDLASEAIHEANDKIDNLLKATATIGA